MCELCDGDRVTVLIADEIALPVLELAGECEGIIADLERHLDRERDQHKRWWMAAAIVGLKGSANSLRSAQDATYQYKLTPSVDEMLARYPHPDVQQP